MSDGLWYPDSAATGSDQTRNPKHVGVHAIPDEELAALRPTHSSSNWVSEGFAVHYDLEAIEDRRSIPGRAI